MRRAEWVVALVLTLAIVCLHFRTANFAGALWRDEANTVGLATLSSVREVWQNLQYDSFPMLWLLIVRALAGVFGAMNDPAFRSFGFLVGLGLVGALWFNAHTFGRSAPLLSLVLVAMSPNVIRWGDSLRAYGFGILLILTTGALLWRFVEHPRTGRLVLVTLAAVASVHVLFYNAVLLLALSSGAVAVCVRRREYKTAAAVLLICSLAAISMLPYATTIRNASTWNMLVQIPHYTFGWFWNRLSVTVGAAGIIAIVAWVELSALATVCGTVSLIFPSKFTVSSRDRDVVLFSLVTFVTCAVAMFLFLHVLSYPTEPWYYLALLGLAGVCIDALFGALIHTPSARITRLAGVLLLAAFTIAPAVRAARTRLTNADLIAARLRTIAGAKDIILLNVWPGGVSFGRYYRGAAPWLTVPPLGFNRVHRYDLLKEKMRMTDQTEPVRQATDRAEAVLQSGHRVFLVDDSFFLSRSPALRILEPAPLANNRWPADFYSEQWSAMARVFLRQHARTLTVVPVPADATISVFENWTLLAADGWKP